MEARLALGLAARFAFNGACFVGGVFNIRFKTSSREFERGRVIPLIPKIQMSDHSRVKPGPSKVLFAGPVLKLLRAGQHIRELETVLAPWMAANPKIEPHYVADQRMHTVSWRTDREPLEIPVIIGDILHNLRSALDLMASEMALRRGRSAKSVYFPFATSPDHLRTQIKDKNFDRCGKAAVEHLKTLRPYESGNLMLRAIHDLNVMDKHQQIMPVSSSTELFDFDLKQFADGTKFLGPGPDAKKPTVHLVFPKDTALADRELVQTLKDLVQVCEGVIVGFAALEKAAEKGS